MKKGLLYLSMIALIGFSFAACSDDDETDYAPEVAGAYEGNMSIYQVTIVEGDTNYLQIGSVEDTLIVTRTSDNYVSLKLENFNIGLTQLGDIEAKNIVVKRLSEPLIGEFFMLEGTSSLDLTETVLETTGAVRTEGVILEGECSAMLWIVLGTGMIIEVDFETEGF